MNDPVLTALGLARRAGKLIPGADALTALAAPPALLIAACDVSPRTLRRLTNAGMTVTPSPRTMAELGRAVGCGNAAVLAVTDAGFAEMIRRKMEQQEENE